MGISLPSKVTIPIHPSPQKKSIITILSSVKKKKKKRTRFYWRDQLAADKKQKPWPSHTVKQSKANSCASPSHESSLHVMQIVSLVPLILLVACSTHCSSCHYLKFATACQFSSRVVARRWFVILLLISLL